MIRKNAILMIFPRTSISPIISNVAIELARVVTSPETDCSFTPICLPVHASGFFSRFVTQCINGNAPERTIPISPTIKNASSTEPNPGISNIPVVNSTPPATSPIVASRINPFANSSKPLIRKRSAFHSPNLIYVQ